MSVSVSKSTGYAVLSPPANGVSVAKAQGYVVVQALTEGVWVAKSVGYAVVKDAVAAATARPQVAILA